MPHVSRMKPLHRIAAGLLLLSAFPAAKADCFFDNRGREVCNGLSNGARIGIGIGIFVAAMLLLFAIGLQRRRRIQRANQAYITAVRPQAHPAGNQYSYNNNNQQYGGANQQYGAYDPTNAGQPQYPPQTHPGQYNGNGAGGYNAQGYEQNGPPQYSSYAPPPGPPPTKV